MRFSQFIALQAILSSFILSSLAIPLNVDKRIEPGPILQVEDGEPELGPGPVIPHTVNLTTEKKRFAPLEVEDPTEFNDLPPGTIIRPEAKKREASPTVDDTFTDPSGLPITLPVELGTEQKVQAKRVLEETDILVRPTPLSVNPGGPIITEDDVEAKRASNIKIDPEFGPGPVVGF